MMVFLREVTTRDDRILLSPLTWKEYIKLVNYKIMERKKDIDQAYALYNKNDGDSEEEIEKNKEMCLRLIKVFITFEYYPIPCKNYRSNNRWIKTENLERYRR